MSSRKVREAATAAPVNQRRTHAPGGPRGRIWFLPQTFQSPSNLAHWVNRTGWKIDHSPVEPQNFLANKSTTRAAAPLNRPPDPDPTCSNTHTRRDPFPYPGELSHSIPSAFGVCWRLGRGKGKIDSNNKKKLSDIARATTGRHGVFVLIKKFFDFDELIHC